MRKVGLLETRLVPFPHRHPASPYLSCSRIFFWQDKYFFLKPQCLFEVKGKVFHLSELVVTTICYFLHSVWCFNEHFKGTRSSYSYAVLFITRSKFKFLVQITFGKVFSIAPFKQNERKYTRLQWYILLVSRTNNVVLFLLINM